MAVKPTDLDNQERDFDLNTRHANTTKPTVAEELSSLRGRIATVKRTTPKDESPHCADCFERGWRAAVAAIEA